MTLKTVLGTLLLGGAVFLFFVQPDKASRLQHAHARFAALQAKQQAAREEAERLDRQPGDGLQRWQAMCNVHWRTPEEESEYAALWDEVGDCDHRTEPRAKPVSADRVERRVRTLQ